MLKLTFKNHNSLIQNKIRPHAIWTEFRKFWPWCAQQFQCALAIPMYTFLFYVLRYATGCESEERRCLYKVGPTLLLFNDLHFPKPFLECVYKKQNKKIFEQSVIVPLYFYFSFSLSHCPRIGWFHLSINSV